jgi:hypothetical protein
MIIYTIDSEFQFGQELVWIAYNIDYKFQFTHIFVWFQLVKVCTTHTIDAKFH